MDPDQPQQDSPIACVITQKYSYATFVSLHFHSCKGKLHTQHKNAAISIFVFF
jgi:hypothetical protein